MAVGDGGGTLPTPNGSQTALIAEKRRAALNSLSVDAANSSQIIAEQIIPESEGGFWIREIGLYDADGVLIAVANCPETYKPLLQEGSGRTQTVRMILIVSSADAVTLKVDPSVVLATRKYVDDRVIEVKAYADSLMAKHLAATDPHPQYAPKASPALTGKPTAPTAAKADYSTQLATTEHVKAVVADYAPLNSPAFSGVPTVPTALAGNDSQQAANTAFVQAAIGALVAGSPAALDTLKELADALGGDAHFSTTVLNSLAQKMDISSAGSAAGRDVGNSQSFHIPDMSFFNLTGKGTDNLLVKGPNGLIIQIFRRNLPNSTTIGVPQSLSVTYPTPFPGGVWGAFCTKMTYAQIVTSCESVNKTGFDAVTCLTAGTSPDAKSSDAVFLVIGY